MVKIWGKIIKNNRIIKDEVAICYEDVSYQQALKLCINEICDKLDIPKPYWLPVNLKRYNQFNKTFFNEDNFIEEIDFDRFAIEELEYK